MLQALDQWALGVLMAMSGFFGLQPLPEKVDPNWEIVQNWKELPGGTYELVMRSTEAVNFCREHQKYEVVFPSILMVKYSIKLDKNLILSNSLNNSWDLDGVYDQPTISCLSLIEGVVVLYKVESYLKSFAKISNYPRFRLKRSVYNFFRSNIFEFVLAVSSSLALVLPLVLFSIKLYTRHKLLTFFVQQIFFIVMLLGLQPSVVGYIPVSMTQIFVFIGLWGGVASCTITALNLSPRIIYSVISFILPLSFLAQFAGKNLLQLLIFIPIPVFVLTLLVGVFRKEKSRRIQFLILVICILGVREGLNALLQWQQVNLLPLVTVCFSILSFSLVFRDALKKSHFNKLTEENLKNEKKFNNKLTNMQERHLSLLHDLKSPITSLSFLLSAKELNQKALSITVRRIKSLLKEIKEDSLGAEPDWYGVSLLEEQLELLKIEKEASLKNFIIIFHIGKDLSGYEVFLNLQDMYGIISELIDNTVKNDLSVSQVKIYIKVNIQEQSLHIYYIDELVIKKTKVNNNSTKKGLKIINYKMKRCGGEYSRVSRGFEIRLRAREKGAV